VRDGPLGQDAGKKSESGVRDFSMVSDQGCEDKAIFRRRYRRFYQNLCGGVPE